MRLSVLALALTTLASAQDLAFRPVLDRASVLPAVVAPGGSLSLSCQYRNTGTTGATQPYRLFVHFEDPVRHCERIVWQADHEPVEPLGFWLPGETVVDGPLQIPVPDNVPAGVYRVHVGVFSPGGGARLVEADAGQVTVDSQAGAGAGPSGPPALSDDELARRRAAASALRQPRTLRTEAFDFSLETPSGQWVLTDRRAGVSWTSDRLHERLGRLLLRRGSELRPVVLNALTPVAGGADELVCEQPLGDTGLTLRLRCGSDARPPAGLRLSYEVRGESAWSVERVWLLDNGLPVTEAEAGRTVLPLRLGRGLTAASGLPTVESRLTYDDSSMQMLTVEHQGAALLVTWDGVDVRWTVRRNWLDDPRVAGARLLQHTVELAGGARQVTLHPLGRGDYVTAARAYRDVAARAGWRVARAPGDAPLAGAADFKPFVFTRTVAGSRYNPTAQDKFHVGFTFAETAQLAEHWRGDLQLDKAMVVLAGWIKRGYDNQHPDILPAAPECGGDAALAAAGLRIKACGYLFGLHDNYQDMYADAPSFDHRYLRKGADGRSLKGGNWAGGQAWQVRPQSQLDLARRNLPDVVKLCAPTAYFIDTVFAWGLVDSQAPGDLWNRQFDLEAKQRLCAYARQQTGVFGSEEGREWAVPVADYLEGQFGQKWDTPPGEVLPTFLLAYHDCVNTTTHQSTRLGPDDDKHLLDHLVYAEMPVYSFGEHLYWRAAEVEPVPVTVAASVQPAGPGAFDLTYRWLPSGTPAADYRPFVHFTQPGVNKSGEAIAFQDSPDLGHTSGWTAGREVVVGPRLVTVPEGVRGEVQVWCGLLNAASARQRLAQAGGVNGRYLLGTLKVGATEVTFTPTASGTAARPFARREGWTRDLGLTDRFIKNSYEVLSWVHRLTYGVPFEAHEVANGVERTRFGADLRIVANYGAAPVTVDAGPVLGQVRLGQYGFAVWSPGFVAVHALAAGGREYATPALYTARSLDGRPLLESARVRVYHGCGGPALGLAGRTVTVEREGELALRN